MKSRGLLMIEHRLIEKMILIIDKECGEIRKSNIVDPFFIDTAVDFIRTYADRTHHGKEEGILFKELEAKKLKGDDEKLMKELIDDHKRARKTVGELVEAKTRYEKGDGRALDEILRLLTWLVEFYPHHIRKEDAVFFPEAEKYFSDSELELQLREYYEFDMKMIHEKYGKVVSDLRAKYSF